MSPSEQMKHLVTDLIEQYEAEVRSNGLLYLELRLHGPEALIIEETIKQRQVCVGYWLCDVERHPVPEPAIWFHLAPDGRWFPYEVHSYTTGNHTFADWDMANGTLIVTAPTLQARLATIADRWSQVLRAQGWVNHATKYSAQPQIWPEDEDAPDQPPEIQDLWDWMDEYGLCTATDGCWVQPDGVCEHGHKSWLVALDLL